MATPAQKLAEENPWYLLATLYGVPDWLDHQLQSKNCVTWNRYYASLWTDKQRKRLKGWIDEVELKPFDDKELEIIQKKFVERAGTNQIDMPNFREKVDFIGCRFEQAIHFCGYVFCATNFRSVIFCTHADFNGAIFFKGADFSNATFSGGADFTSAIFPERSYFSSTIFSDNVRFTSAKLSKRADFSSATFSGRALFDSTIFLEDANFSGAAFSRDANFSSATFHSTALFINTELNALTNFKGCHFEKYPPQFAGAKLHEGTVWRGVSWPHPPADPKDAGHFTDAYERLKLEMDRLKKHEDELMFFAKELQCRRVAAGQFRGLPIGIYGVLCNYGQSYLRPLGWLLALILVGAVQFWPVLGWDFLLSLGVSTANTLGPLGLRKELIEAGTLPDLSRWLRFLSGTQMVMGLILLFLIGLGLRNRFRMR